MCEKALIFQTRWIQWEVGKHCHKKKAHIIIIVLWPIPRHKDSLQRPIIYTHLKDLQMLVTTFKLRYFTYKTRQIYHIQLVVLFGHLFYGFFWVCNSHKRSNDVQCSRLKPSMPFKRDLGLQNIPLSKQPFKMQPQIENEDITWSPQYHLQATRTNKRRALSLQKVELDGLILNSLHRTQNMYFIIHAQV